MESTVSAEYADKSAYRVVLAEFFRAISTGVLFRFNEWGSHERFHFLFTYRICIRTWHD